MLSAFGESPNTAKYFERMLKSYFKKNTLGLKLFICLFI